MGNALYPSLPGLAFDVVKAPTFDTVIRTTRTLAERRRANRAAPIYNMTLNYEFLRDDASYQELQSLFGFYLQRGGAFDSFLLVDPDDSTATDELFGTGDGVTVAFQLVRIYGGEAEPVANIDDATLVIKVDGISKALGTDYTVNSTGRITFTVAPALAAVLTWSGEFYYRCRFADDQLDFTKFMDQLWSLKGCNLVGSLGTAI